MFPHCVQAGQSPGTPVQQQHEDYQAAGECDQLS